MTQTKAQKALFIIATVLAWTVPTFAVLAIVLFVI